MCAVPGNPAFHSRFTPLVPSAAAAAAGLAQAQTIKEPERLMSHIPPEWRTRSRAEANHRTMTLHFTIASRALPLVLLLLLLLQVLRRRRPSRSLSA
jgi:hypothetical protein